MTQLIERDGSLFESTADAYAHGVNTEGLMGAGIAVLFKRLYPEMYAAYKIICKETQFVAGEVWVWDTDYFIPRWIYNIASQDRPGPNAKLEWFERGLVRALKHAEDNDVRHIAMPRIGCGIGGLDWEDVRDIIEHYAERSPVDIEVWTPLPPLV